MQKINKDQIVHIQSHDKELFTEFYELPYKKGLYFIRKPREEGNYHKDNHGQEVQIKVEDYINNAYIIEGNSIYLAPRVIITLTNRDHFVEYFPTLVKANIYLQSFKSTNLIKI